MLEYSWDTSEYNSDSVSVSIDDTALSAILETVDVTVEARCSCTGCLGPVGVMIDTRDSATGGCPIFW